MKLSKKNPLLDLCLLIFLAFLITIIWFHQGLLYGGGEEGLSFYNPSLTLKTVTNLWQDSYLGLPSVYQIIKLPLYYVASLIYLFAVPNFIIQAFIHFLLFCVGMISIYYLFRATVSPQFKYRFLPLFGAVFYLLNLYSMSQIWARGLYMQFIPFASFPLMLLLVYLGLTKKRIIFILLALIVSFVFSAGFTPAYILSFWLMEGFVFGYFFISNYITKISNFKTIRYFLVFFIGWIALHLWWLSSLFLLSGTLFLSNVAVTNEGLGTLMAVSKYSPLTSVIRLMQNGYFNTPWLFGNFYQTITFQLLSWLIPLLALFSLPKIKELKALKFFGALFLLGLFICLGANFPLGFLFVFLFNHLPLLQLFRDPYEKFGLVLLIAYIPFVCVGFFSLSKKLTVKFKTKGRILAGLIIFITFVILVGPMWTGLVIKTNEPKNLVQVPDYYKALGSWMDRNNQGKNRIFMLPLMPGDGVTYLWNGKVYSGVDPINTILDYSVISFAALHPYQKELMAALYKNIDKIDLSNTLGLLRAKYLVIRDDVSQVSDRDLKQEQNILGKLFSPKKLDQNMPEICHGVSSGNLDSNHITLNCKISENLGDWGRYRYLHLILKTNTPAALDIAIRDQNEQRPRWDGTVSPEFRTNGAGPTTFTLDLSLPIYGDMSKFDYSTVRFLDILAYPNPSTKGVSASKIEIVGAFLDTGQEQKVDNYQFIDKFGKLRLYQLKKYQDFPEVNSPTNIKIVDQLNNLLEEAASLTTVDGNMAYVVKAQNTNFVPLTNFSSLQPRVKKIEDYKYRVEFSENNDHYLVLHKTFNPLWRIVPNISDKDLDGSIESDIKLARDLPLEEKNHFIVNGYANLWKVDKGYQKVVIIFWPQIILNLLLKFSLLVLALICAVVIVFLRQMGHNQRIKK